MRYVARHVRPETALAIAMACIPIAPVQGQCTLQEIHTPTPYHGHPLGISVALNGETLLVGTSSGSNSEAVHLLEYDSQVQAWAYRQALAGPDRDGSFGSSVALDDNWALVGARGHGGAEIRSGAVYAYEYSPETSSYDFIWLFSPSDGETLDHFGGSISLNGTLAAVGADGDSDAGANSGSVYVFSHAPPNSFWVQADKLTASDAAAEDRFGTAVAIRDDLIAVGAPQKDCVGPASGSVYTFRRDAPDDTWQQTWILTADDGAAGDQFGQSLAVDQGTIIVGAPAQNAAEPSSGAAYVFRFDPASKSWEQRQRLAPLDAHAGQGFGWSVSIDGDRIVVGAPGDGILGVPFGAVYAFQREDDSDTWFQLAKLTAPDAREGDAFGRSVVVRGAILLSGATGDDDGSTNAGSLYAFRNALPVADCAMAPLPGTCYADCNENGIRDTCDILAGSSQDCDQDARPDECGFSDDCNQNAVPDTCDVIDGTSHDCNRNLRPDECELDDDCNQNEVPDACDLADGTSHDCNENGIPEECEPLFDCNENGEQDTCDIASGLSLDEDGNGLPDECPLLTIAYVARNADGNQDGDSWQNAFNDIHQALRAAELYPGIVEEIRIAQGTYTPAPPNGDREASFRITTSAVIRGGYAGPGNSDPSERDAARYLTTLSGDLNGDDIGDLSDPSRSENSLRVVVVDTDAAPVTLDGFAITGGQADDDGIGTGAGLFSTRSSLSLIDCTFRSNYSAGHGGGLATRYGDLTAQRCIFIDNAADWIGEAMAEGSGPQGNLNPNPNSGGGLYSYSTDVALIGCSFTGNTSVGGSAIWAASSACTLRNCAIIGNRTKCDDEFGIVFATSWADMEDCEVSECNGGGILTYSSLRLTNCEFRSNAGRAIDSSVPPYGFLRVSGCAFIKNTVGDSGAAIRCRGDEAAEIADCTFLDNTAGEDGGAFWGIGTLNRCLFTGNTATNGGGCYLSGGAPSLWDCAFMGNVAEVDGGAVYFDAPTALIGRSTLGFNSANSLGGGVYSADGVSVLSSIAWGNTDANGSDEFSQLYSATASANVEFSNTQGWTAEGLGGFSNIDADPRFTDALDGDLRLLPDSPCINAGSFTFCSPCCETDIDGHPRSLCGRHDMGAYEFGIGDYDCDHDVDLEDYASWSDCLFFPNTFESCEAFDTDADCDVDLHDFGAFQVAIGGQ